MLLGMVNVDKQELLIDSQFSFAMLYLIISVKRNTSHILTDVWKCNDFVHFYYSKILKLSWRSEGNHTLFPILAWIWFFHSVNLKDFILYFSYFSCWYLSVPLLWDNIWNATHYFKTFIHFEWIKWNHIEFCELAT